jgi:hypothetical protein
VLRVARNRGFVDADVFFRGVSSTGVAAAIDGVLSTLHWLPRNAALDAELGWDYPPQDAPAALPRPPLPDRVTLSPLQLSSVSI